MRPLNEFYVLETIPKRALVVWNFVLGFSKPNWLLLHVQSMQEHKPKYWNSLLVRMDERNESDSPFR